MKTLDLHGVRHDQASLLVEEFICRHELPVRVITGNSRKMKTLMLQAVGLHALHAVPENDWNMGSFLIFEHLPSPQEVEALEEDTP